MSFLSNKPVVSKLLLLLQQSPIKKFNTTNTNNTITQVLMNHQFGPSNTTTAINTTTCTIRKYHSNVIATSSNDTIDNQAKVFPKSPITLDSSTTNKVNYFPIGVDNFESIIRNGQFYIDKTHFIPLIEKQLDTKLLRYGIPVHSLHPKEVVLARPHGWGKTTFLSMIHCYYDVKKTDEFNDLFGNLNIGKNCTTNRNSYHVLKFDFSNVKSNFTTLEEFHHEINSIIKKSLLQFIDYYQLPFFDELDANSPSYKKYHSPNYSRYTRENRNKEITANIELLYYIFNCVNPTEYTINKLLVLVDEFDKQINELILQNPKLFESFLKQDKRDYKVYNPTFYPFDKFFSEFENKMLVHRLFVSTTPIVFSSKGVGKYLKTKSPNWDDEFQDCIGFTIHELKQNALNNYKLNDEIIEKLVANYGNYHFRGTKTTLLNPSMVLREFNCEEPLLLSQINSKKYEKLLDHIETLVGDKESGIWALYFKQFINFNTFVKYDANFTIEYLISYLVYQGLLSVKGYEFSVPNQFARQSLHERHSHKLQQWISEIQKTY